MQTYSSIEQWTEIAMDCFGCGTWAESSADELLRGLGHVIICSG